MKTLTATIAFLIITLALGVPTWILWNQSIGTLVPTLEVTYIQAVSLLMLSGVFSAFRNLFK